MARNGTARLRGSGRAGHGSAGTPGHGLAAAASDRVSLARLCAARLSTLLQRVPQGQHGFHAAFFLSQVRRPPAVGLFFSAAASGSHSASSVLGAVTSRRLFQPSVNPQPPVREYPLQLCDTFWIRRRSLRALRAFRGETPAPGTGTPSPGGAGGCGAGGERRPAAAGGEGERHPSAAACAENCGGIREDMNLNHCNSSSISPSAALVPWNKHLPRFIAAGLRGTGRPLLARRSGSCAGVGTVTHLSEGTFAEGTGQRWRQGASEKPSVRLRVGACCPPAISEVNAPPGRPQMRRRRSQPLQLPSQRFRCPAPVSPVPPLPSAARRGLAFSCSASA
ncbi:uncharacterized protein LOC141916082 [Strix aluco]|uniref:uncharacterized protein LOC141916082 n=1 Tax=Strix aluco TaxID=111821 RepID=UPI003DA609F9